MGVNTILTCYYKKQVSTLTGIAYPLFLCSRDLFFLRINIFKIAPYVKIVDQTHIIILLLPQTFFI